MSLTASVVSAAILEGRLIIGLSDGSVIDCGYVQGPPGLQGNPGPMGADGDAGRDGNTIHTVAGTPRNDMGVDGDYAIDNINWRIYGPKSGGIWGKANDMLPSKDNLIANGRAPSASGGGGGGDSNTDGGAARVYNTGNLRLTGTGKSGTPFVDTPGGNIIPEGTGLKFQANANGWFVDSLQALDTALPIDKVTKLPDAGKYQGDMVLYKDALWVYHGTEWIEVGGAVDTDGLAHVEVGETAPDTGTSTTGDFWFNSAPTELTLYIFDGTDWIPAAPPVSLDGIDSRISYLEPLVESQQQAVGRLNKVTVDQQKRIENLEESGGSGGGGTDPRLPYRLGTDKAAKAGIASIELVDAENNFSNVHLNGINGIKTESTINGINIDGSGLLTESAANKKYLSDGTTTNKLMINRTAGGSIDSMKVTNITGGATVWRLDAKAGSDGPIIYKTEGLGFHKFVGSVFCDRVGDTKGGFTIEGRRVDGDIGNLFHTYHNSGSAPDAINYFGKIDSANNIVNKGYVDSIAQYPSTKYDKKYKFIDGTGTSTVAPGQVLFTDITNIRMTNPEKVANICLCKSDFNWNAFIYNGIVKVINDVDVISGYFLVVDYMENAGRNMTLNVKYLDRGGSGGSLNPTLDCTLSFRNCFYN